MLTSDLFRREWTEDGQLWVQYVSSTPATRLDVINLQEKLDQQLQQRQVCAAANSAVQITQDVSAWRCFCFAAQKQLVYMREQSQSAVTDWCQWIGYASLLKSTAVSD
jgi:hypothetical protein